MVEIESDLIAVERDRAVDVLTGRTTTSSGNAQNPYRAKGATSVRRMHPGLGGLLPLEPDVEAHADQGEDCAEAAEDGRGKPSARPRVDRGIGGVRRVVLQGYDAADYRLRPGTAAHVRPVEERFVVHLVFDHGAVGDAGRPLPVLHVPVDALIDLHHRPGGRAGALVVALIDQKRHEHADQQQNDPRSCEDHRDDAQSCGR